MAISDIAGRVSRATDVGTETIEGLFKLRALADASDIKRTANVLAARKLDQDALIEQGKLQVDALKADLLNQQENVKEYAKALSENPALATDEAFIGMYNTANTNYNNSKQMLYGLLNIEMPASERALDITRHLRGTIDPVGRKWSGDTTKELIRRFYPDADMESIEAIWKGLDSMDKNLGKAKEVADGKLKPRLSGAGAIVEGGGILGDLLLDAAGVVPTALQSIYKGEYSPVEFNKGDPVTDYLERVLGVEKRGASQSREGISTDEKDSSLFGKVLDSVVSPAGAADFRSGSEKGRTTRQRKRIPIEPEEAMGGLVGGMGLMGLGLMGADNYLARQAEADRMKDYGETSQLLSPESIAELQSMNRGVRGTGGMLTFSQGMSLSTEARTFLENLATVTAQFGEERARAYMTRELAKLSEADQEAVLNAIEEL